MAASRQDAVVHAVTARADAGVLEPTIWVTDSFAPEWFCDALREARTGRDHHSRRREILFAVCFAESYLFEWVRDEVLKRDYPTLNAKYWGVLEKRSVTARWAVVLNRLLGDGLIPAVPRLTKHHLKQWRRLVRYRNGLAHAHASRAGSASLRKKKKPVPSKAILGRLPAGWAVRVVIWRVRLLHKAVRTRPPPWLVYP